LGFVLVIMGLTLISITPVDDTDYRQSDYYSRSLNNLDSALGIAHQLAPGVEVGWGQATITPSEPIRLTGKNWTPYQQVFDSLYVRCFVLKTSNATIALINYDLWIMHPHLTEHIRTRVAEEYPQINGIYFTANHTHTGIGGWASGLLGTLVVGGNNPETVEFLEAQTMRALSVAQSRASTTWTSYGEVATKGLVENRLDTTGKLDTRLRFLEFQNLNGRAVFSTYAAHSVYMNKDINTLSADYPGGFLAKLTADPRIDFAAFAPGATGSHTPVGRKPFTRAKMDNYAQSLYDYWDEATDNSEWDSLPSMRFMQWPIELGSAHFRISNKWRLRPGIFNAVMGKPQPYITAIRLGNTVLVGLPIELSGEYYSEFDQVCKERGLNLIITSFNGTYLGYANPERYYYNLKRAETREMNWYGPQSGTYFTDLINHLLEKI